MIPILVLIALHLGSGVEVDLNPEAVTAMRNPDPRNPSPHFTDGVNCMISLNDGKYITVQETCAEVRKIMERE